MKEVLTEYLREDYFILQSSSFYCSVIVIVSIASPG